MRALHRPCSPIWLVLGLAMMVIPDEARADPIAVRSGKVVLPITGLAIELPKDARKKATWMLSGSWSLSNNGASFDGRDVVDLSVGGKLVAGNWIHVGYFDAGACDKVVQELDVTERWSGEADLFGQHFHVNGGLWDFENELGKAPAVALCTSAAGGQSLLLYHFFLERGAVVGKQSLVALGKDKLLDRVTRAWSAGTTSPVWPTRRPEIRRRGDLAAVRTVYLGQSNLEVALPDDGFIWLARIGEGSDFLDRMAPSLPDMTLEVARAPGAACAEVLAGVAEALGTVDEAAPTGVPAGWTAFPTLKVEANLERVLCREVGGAALVVGLIATPVGATASRDFGPFRPVLEALVSGTVRAP